MHIQIRPAGRKKGTKKRLNLKELVDPAIGNALQVSVTAKLQTVGETGNNVTKDTESLMEEWSQISKCLMDASVEETLGYSSRKHRDWIDENKNNAIIRDLLKTKNEAHTAPIRSPHNAALRDRSNEIVRSRNSGT